jgi:hypothetical protein
VPTRSITVDGRSWRVYPSGFVTANQIDEFGLIFVAPTADGGREVRVTRYSPAAASRRREASLGELSEADLATLLTESQPSATSPETGYSG